MSTPKSCCCWNQKCLFVYLLQLYWRKKNHRQFTSGRLDVTFILTFGKSVNENFYLHVLKIKTTIKTIINEDYNYRQSYVQRWYKQHLTALMSLLKHAHAQMTNLWVTGTRWDKSKYFQGSGSSLSRLVTVNISAMSQWNVSSCHFVALSLAESDARVPAGKLWGPDLKLLVWHSHSWCAGISSAVHPRCGHGIMGFLQTSGGMMKKGSCCQSTCATQTLGLWLKAVKGTSVADSWLSDVSGGHTAKCNVTCCFHTVTLLEGHAAVK